MSDDRTVKKVFLGQTRWKKKSRKTKIKEVRLYWELSEIYGCQEVEGERRRQIGLGYHAEGGNG
jgi:hypothetical protein